MFVYDSLSTEQLQICYQNGSRRILSSKHRKWLGKHHQQDDQLEMAGWTWQAIVQSSQWVFGRGSEKSLDDCYIFGFSIPVDEQNVRINSCNVLASSNGLKESTKCPWKESSVKFLFEIIVTEKNRFHSRIVEVCEKKTLRFRIPKRCLSSTELRRF